MTMHMCSGLAYLHSESMNKPKVRKTARNWGGWRAPSGSKMENDLTRDLSFHSQPIPSSEILGTLSAAGSSLHGDNGASYVVKQAESRMPVFSPTFQVVHGDIKPENILLDEYLKARLSDFGISRVGESEAGAPVRSRARRSSGGAGGGAAAGAGVGGGGPLGGADDLQGTFGCEPGRGAMRAGRSEAF